MNEGDKFELVDPFEVDDGSLDGLPPAYIFTLGVEWETFRQQLSDGTPFITFCLPENRTRFVRMAERKKRFVEDRPTGSASWVEIWVGGCLER